MGMTQERVEALFESLTPETRKALEDYVAAKRSIELLTVGADNCLKVVLVKQERSASTSSVIVSGRYTLNDTLFGFEEHIPLQRIASIRDQRSLSNNLLVKVSDGIAAVFIEEAIAQERLTKAVSTYIVGG